MLKAQVIQMAKTFDIVDFFGIFIIDVGCMIGLLLSKILFVFISTYYIISVESFIASIKFRNCREQVKSIY